MLSAIVWKEFREQGLIGLTLLVFGAGILVAAATLADPPTQGASPADVLRFLGAGMLAAMMLAVTAGTVCGGALFAAEREAGTIGFLESLPGSRWQLWRAKLAAGTLLAAVEIGVVLVVAAALGLVQSANWALAIAVFSLLSFVWGVYGSTIAGTTLGSVGVALPAASGAFILFYVPLAILFQNPRTNMLQPEGGLIFLGLMFATPLLGSAMRFTRHDRERTADDPTPVRRRLLPADSLEPQPDEIESRPTRIGIHALLWLSWRQLWKPALVLIAFALVLGLSLLSDSMHPVILWPGLALSAGVLAGVTMFMDEQSSGSLRFWGERRMPVGRLWLVKLAMHGAFAVILALILLIPSAIRAEAEGMQLIRGGSFLTFSLRSLLFDSSHLGSQGWKLIALPLVYGFVAGHLCGLLFRKTVVAAGVAGVVGGSLAAFWLPSLLGGGVWHWQLWTPPLVALATARLLLRAWSSERLPTRRPIQTLVGGLAAVLLVMAAGIGWRVLEVPKAEASDDDVHYIASLPSLEVDDSGRQFRTAAERFARVSQSIPAFPKTAGGVSRGSLDERITNLPFHVWSENDLEVAEWLRNVYELDATTGEQDEAWYVQAEKAGREPTDGIFEHPLRTGTSASLITQANGRRMGAVLLGHGLQKQASGDPGVFPGDLRTALALSRTFRNGSMTSSLNYGNEVARAGYSATDRWLADYNGPPEHLKHAIRVLHADDSTLPFDPRPHLLAERFVMRELVKAPGQFLPAQLTPPGRDREHVAPIVDLVGVAWNVPWERERTNRLLGMGFEAGGLSLETRRLVRGRPGVYVFLARRSTPDEMAESDRQVRLHRRAALLEVAVRLHQLEKGVAPASLGALVAAGYLPSVPLDPYDDQPLRYRVSAGETLVTPPIAGSSLLKSPPMQEPRSIPAGQPVIWSVGPDRSDEGGRSLPTRPGTLRSGSDLVFLVPLAATNP